MSLCVSSWRLGREGDTDQKEEENRKGGDRNMVLQETHTCDVCGEKYYVPEEPNRKLKVNEGLTDEMECDLCFNCHESLMKWILSRKK